MGQFQGRTQKIGRKKRGRKDEKNANFGPNLAIFGTEIVVFGLIKENPVENRPENFCEWPVF